MLGTKLYIRVRYSDNSYDYIAGMALDKFIHVNKIKQFYRYSEEKWITVGVDPIRRRGRVYSGAEKRSMN